LRDEGFLCAGVALKSEISAW